MTFEASPLLTIAIPTFTRANYLELNLRSLVAEARTLPPGVLEVIVSDNHSTDSTPDVVANAIAQGLPIRYIRNKIDVGSDANIAQCFNEARGDYVQIMGDDDIYVAGTLSYLIDFLQKAEYGVVVLRPFGYEVDPIVEHPGGDARIDQYDQVGDFLAAIGPYITFISSCVINRRVQQEIDARQFCGSNLVQVHLVVNAALQVGRNAYLKRYILACKRANSGGYDFSEVFVERLGRILDSYRPAGLSEHAIQQFETRMLKSYHPFNLVRQRLARQGDLRETYRRFSARFGNRPLFRFWVAPIIRWPRPLALGWGMMATLVGRLANGDLRRGAHFLLNKLRRGGRPAS
ncbi:glycosyltransferase family 2 protein [Paraburkholderia sp. BL21I4N1]|uniref:glycosyltransferase family 2 protein n=1 Tax=Paraburkholderia sp. BL21I4N1 TaxID=1938801 RepID=UPI000CFD77E7|nr:glycosyltransferase family 2 protein [Paraburkholderia sp. BL21I4N1]PQV52503.1 glycosyltransferase involved in cell wall biosynthesis [Paraburkholderia sp. BL21I4N1]